MRTYINKIKNIIKNKLNTIKQILDLEHEVGGYIDINTDKLVIKNNGNKLDPSINSLVHHDFNSNLVTFHTHVRKMNKLSVDPLILFLDSTTKDSKKIINSKLFFVPSEKDLETSLYAALHYNYPTIQFIISDNGIFIYWIEHKFLDFLNNIKLKIGEDKFKIFIENNIKKNIGNITGDFFIDHKNIKKFQEELQNLLKIDNNIFGWNSIFIKYDEL